MAKNNQRPALPPILPSDLPSEGWKAVWFAKEKKTKIGHVRKLESGRTLLSCNGNVFDAEQLLSAGCKFYPLLAVTEEVQAAMLTVVTTAQANNNLLQAIDGNGSLGRAVLAFRKALIEIGIIT